MADEFDESCLELGEFNVNDMIRLQAVCRGWLVRKEMKSIQAEFLETVSELDGTKVDVEWRECGTSVPLPVVKRSKKTRPMKTNPADKMFSSTVCNCKCNTNTKRVNLNSGVKKDVCTVELAAGSESALRNDESKRAQDLSKTLATQEIQTDLRVPLSEEKPCRREECGESKTQHCERDLHHEAKLNDRGDSPYHTDDTRVTEGFEVGDMGGDIHRGVRIGTKSPEPEDTSMSQTPVPNDTSETTAATTPITTLTSTSHPPAASSDKSGGEAFSEWSSKGKMDSFRGDQTSVWNSSSSVTQDHPAETGRCFHVPSSSSKDQLEASPSGPTVESLRSLSSEELLKQRQNVAMELLWVQQAIISRKKYLQLRNQMLIGT